MLEFIVVFGASIALVVVMVFFFINENDFVFLFVLVIVVIDFVGNVCVDINMMFMVSVLFVVASILGIEAAMVNGLAKFDLIIIIGECVNVYELNFLVLMLNVSIVFLILMMVMNCLIVKLNSVFRFGVCECIFGFIVDISGGMGYIEDIDIIYVEMNIILYKIVIFGLF